MIKSNLKGYISLANLTQKDVADLLGCSKQQVSNWCTGHSYPTLQNVLKISKIVNQPVEKIWELQEED